MITPPRSRRFAALVAASALALTACSGGEEPVETSDETASSEPTPSASTEAPEEAEDVTPPGTQLDFGDAATVAYELPGQEEALLKLRVDSAVQGSLADFKGFELDDPYKRRGNYYYVRVTAKNDGKQTVGGFPVPLWGISDDNTLLRAVQFKSSFARCPTEPLPKKFKPKDTFRTCLVYLAPNKGKLQGVSYRPTEEFTPIEWRGPVKMLETKKQQKKKKKKDENKQ